MNLNNNFTRLESLADKTDTDMDVMMWIDGEFRLVDIVK